MATFPYLNEGFLLILVRDQAIESEPSQSGVFIFGLKYQDPNKNAKAGFLKNFFWYAGFWPQFFQYWGFEGLKML